MSFTGITAVYHEIHDKHTNTHCEQMLIPEKLKQVVYIVTTVLERVKALSQHLPGLTAELRELQDRMSGTWENKTGVLSITSQHLTVCLQFRTFSRH
jgi:hypothetical protein